MATPRATGKYQVAAEIDGGLRDALEAHRIREGLTLSIILRRAIMRYLSVDSLGNTVTGGTSGVPPQPALTLGAEALSAAGAKDYVRLGAALNRMEDGTLSAIERAAGLLAAAAKESIAVRAEESKLRRDGGAGW